MTQESLFEQPSALDPEVLTRIERLGADLERLSGHHHELTELVGRGVASGATRMEIFQGYIGVGIAAFIVTLLATPIVRRLAVMHGVIDRPSDPRKVHRMPIAYLGGVAVFLGLMAGILYSYVADGIPHLIDFHETSHLRPDYGHFAVPLSVLLGMTVIALTGLIDDVVGISPRVKIGGQLFAAAALAYNDVGVNLARGVLVPTLGWAIGDRDLTFTLTVFGTSVPIDLVYWTGTAIIAVFVVGACNASNLIDGLDGLLTGTTAIAAMGLLVIALGMAIADDGVLDAPRIVMCMALLGACLGFLPHNFNPATIFLGDCGSLLLGFFTIVIILSLGDTGKTFLVMAGLIIYGIPIIDTVLAIVRRKLAGKRMSDPDSDHLHHMLKRALGVKGAVLSLYMLGGAFAILGVAISTTRALFVYAITLLVASYIVVYAIKIARRAHIEQQAMAYDSRFAAKPKPAGAKAGEPGKPEKAPEPSPSASSEPSGT